MLSLSVSVTVVYAEQTAREGAHLPISNEDGRVYLAQWRHEKADKEESQPYRTHEHGEGEM